MARDVEVTAGPGAQGGRCDGQDGRHAKVRLEAPPLYVWRQGQTEATRSFHRSSQTHLLCRHRYQDSCYDWARGDRLAPVPRVSTRRKTSLENFLFLDRRDCRHGGGEHRSRTDDGDDHRADGGGAVGEMARVDAEALLWQIPDRSKDGRDAAAALKTFASSRKERGVASRYQS